MVRVKAITVSFNLGIDWCGPCRQFTPDLVQFYDKVNSRRGKQDEFEIVWISRCRSVDDFGQYFTHMKWLALPPQEAMVSHHTKVMRACIVNCDDLIFITMVSGTRDNEDNTLGISIK